jgi:hypothetical protein
MTNLGGIESRSARQMKDIAEGKLKLQSEHPEDHVNWARQNGPLREWEGGNPRERSLRKGRGQKVGAAIARVSGSLQAQSICGSRQQQQQPQRRGGIQRWRLVAIMGDLDYYLSCTLSYVE